MFGEEWEPAHGKLINTRYGGKHGDWSGNASKTVNSVHYLMEVQPDSGGEPFRCECVPPSLMLSFQAPGPGVSVAMECVVAKQKARFDRNDPHISKKADEKAHLAAYDAELRGTAAEMPRAAAAPVVNITDTANQLSMLVALHGSGALTDKQFTALAEQIQH